MFRNVLTKCGQHLLKHLSDIFSFLSRVAEHFFGDCDCFEEDKHNEK